MFNKKEANFRQADNCNTCIHQGHDEWLCPYCNIVKDAVADKYCVCDKWRTVFSDGQQL